jgi:hypothetical protein
MYVRDGLLRSLSLRWSLSLRRSLSLVVGLFLSSYGVRGSLSLSVCFCTGHPSTNRSFPPQQKRKGKKKPTETCRAELSTFLSTCVENYFSTFTAYILCLSDCLTAPLPCSPPCPSPSYAPYFSFLLPPPSSLLPPPSFLFSLPQLFQPKLRQCLRIVAAAPVEKFWV